MTKVIAFFLILDTRLVPPSVVASFFAINPILFPEPKSKDGWMSKSILGEELWTKKVSG